jgi:hypothetical protein
MRPEGARSQAALTSEDLARVDALAAERGVTRQEAIGVCLLAHRPANDVPDTAQS